MAARIPANSGGFTLIEILITVLVFGVGILGISALSAKSQQIANKAYQQMQASWKAQELIEAMRANTAGTYIGVTSPSSHACISLGADDPADATSCNSADKLAEEELWYWNQALEEMLPAASWSLGTSGARSTISISWDSDRSGTLDTQTLLEFDR